MDSLHVFFIYSQHKWKVSSSSPSWFLPPSSLSLALYNRLSTSYSEASGKSYSHHSTTRKASVCPLGPCWFGEDVANEDHSGCPSDHCSWAESTKYSYLIFNCDVIVCELGKAEKCVPVPFVSFLKNKNKNKNLMNMVEWYYNHSMKVRSLFVYLHVVLLSYFGYSGGNTE